MTLFEIVECLNDVRKNYSSHTYKILKEYASNSFSPAYTNYIYTLFQGDNKCFSLHKSYRTVTDIEKEDAIKDMEKNFMRQLILYLSND